MVNLSGRVTIRRLPAEGKIPFPEDELILSERDGRTAALHFRPDAARSCGAKSPSCRPNCPRACLRRSLCARPRPPVAVTFEVAVRRRHSQVMRHADALARLLGTHDHPLVLQVAVEAALLNVDDEGKPLPYLSDAYDLVEAAPRTALTPHLESLRKQIVDQLQGKRPAAASESDATGIEAIDWARRRIARGQWTEARRLLDSLSDSPDERTRSLATLYQAVVLAESGAATGLAANAAFNQAIEQLDAGAPADAFRAHNNYANFLLTRSQDQLYNHSFQSASGVEQPLVAGLESVENGPRPVRGWPSQLAAKLPPSQAAALAINRARLYALLADAIAVVDSSLPAKTRFVAGEAAATSEAQRLAEQVVGRTPERRCRHAHGGA